MRERQTRPSSLAKDWPRLIQAEPRTDPFRWAPAPADRWRVWLLALLLASLALSSLSEPPRAEPTEPAPVLRHFDPLLNW